MFGNKGQAMTVVIIILVAAAVSVSAYLGSKYISIVGCGKQSGDQCASNSECCSGVCLNIPGAKTYLAFSKASCGKGDTLTCPEEYAGYKIDHCVFSDFCGDITLTPKQTYTTIYRMCDGYNSGAHPCSLTYYYYGGICTDYCGDSKITGSETCDPPYAISYSGVATGSFKYCAADCRSYVTVNCDDGNPCTTDGADSSKTPPQCKHTPITSGSIGTGRDANNCGGSAGTCKVYQCAASGSSATCAVVDMNNVIDPGRCDGSFYCVAVQGCIKNPAVQCTKDSECNSQPYTCSGCNNDAKQYCKYPQDTINPYQKCVGNSCQPYSINELKALCGTPNCYYSIDCGALCDANKKCTQLSKDCNIGINCQGIEKCTYPLEKAYCTPNCNSGVCDTTCQFNCGTPICAISADCGASCSGTEVKSCGNCGKKTCTNGVWGPCISINNCSVGSSCTEV